MVDIEMHCYMLFNFLDCYWKCLCIFLQELEMHNTLANRNVVNYGPLTESQLAEIKKQVCWDETWIRVAVDLRIMKHISCVSKLNSVMNVLVLFWNAVH